MPPAELSREIERLFDENTRQNTDAHLRLFQSFKDALNSGEIRAAEPDASAASGWRVNAWVKKGILVGFRMGTIVEMSSPAAPQAFFDKSTYPMRTFAAESGVRIVPGGSSIRDGCYVARGVTCMPPMYINVGADVDEHRRHARDSAPDVAAVADARAAGNDAHARFSGKCLQRERGLIEKRLRCRWR